ncbi:divalent-cation tolerance protein CutA [bacterium]|nr:divalent-cation tolerance protein CutA [bacterium]
MVASEVVVVLCTFPEGEGAGVAARALVERGLAACVNILPGATSVYRWKGEVEEAAESLLLIKSTPERLPALTAALAKLHPYDVPEIIALPVAGGSPAYLDWVREVCDDTS